ncbi:MAG: hypothetical protein UX52_C0001G0066 [Candidatus Amesbacteria bacterium GW2011_GWA1_46_35]|uniref:Uncharacterized protein n=1 Tax=Candidatus Amesbacteria bacterium GW2011_GWC2_45_19 TaxID=1618366 RepID=A0A0G1M4G7_9BACT|nr:MAG: hypothetical protein UX05_C0004G0125 [Candidatus Amesbacteria bacterium GW2011_GWC2_45_19]KKU38784.1 MAG: hypothetical protein UX52_C0001G0066 [Candidatus Amesbacteria bacterium GW2011_GWA1_46_35]KKU69286.1 MAG: hypothetical protein UX93_C0002G0125 [Microgenomates group bacterium GW2011_GWC1_47_20]
MDSVQDLKIIMPGTEETTPVPPPPPPTPVIEPPTTSTPAPASDSAQVIKPRKKWGTGVLIGSATALMVLVVGLGFGIWQVKQNQKIKPSLAANCRCITPGSSCYGDRIPNGSCPLDANGQGQACCDKVGDDEDENGDDSARHYITFTCDRCASDRRCQTPDIGTNPRYSTGAAPGACAQVDSCESPGNSNCRVVSLCAESCSGPTPTPRPTPTPAPTPPPTSSMCQRIDILRNGVVIAQNQIQVGDQVVFRGFASAVNTTVTAINFAVSQNGVVTSYAGTGLQLVGGLWQADSPTITIVAASYSVTATPIYP